MKTVGLAAMVVAVVMGAIGVAAGLGGNHGAAIPALIFSFLALATGVILIRD